MSSRLLPGVPRAAVQPVTRPTVPTPFGEVGFTAVFGPWQVPAVPETLVELPSGARIARWTHRVAELELLIGRFDPELDPDHWEPLTDCWAALWRIDARVALPAVSLSLSLPPVLPPGAEAGYDGGQAVAAVRVEDAATKLTIGGPDAEQLCWTAQGGDEVPARWAGRLKEVYRSWGGLDWGADCGDHHGVHWTLPPLEPGDHCLLPAGIAWAPVGHEDDANTVFALPARATWLLDRLTGR